MLSYEEMCYHTLKDVMMLGEVRETAAEQD